MNKDVHICPILMRTVLWEDGKCTEKCSEEDCPIKAIVAGTEGNGQSDYSA